MMKINVSKINTFLKIANKNYGNFINFGEIM